MRDRVFLFRYPPTCVWFNMRELASKMAILINELSNVERVRLGLVSQITEILFRLYIVIVVSIHNYSF